MKSYSSYELSKKERNRFLLICGTSLFTAAYLFYHSLTLSLLFAGLAYPGIKPYRSYLADRTRKELQDQFRDMLYSISASVCAGRQMPEALLEARDNLKLIYRDDTVLVLELSEIVKRLFEYRESEDDILKDFAFRTCVADITDFVDIYLTCRETGGDLIKVLTKTSDMITDKIVIEKEIRTITAQKKFEARILTAIPFIIILFLQLIAPEYISPLYQGATGRLLMTLAFGGIAGAYFWSMKLTRIQI